MSLVEDFQYATHAVDLVIDQVRTGQPKPGAEPIRLVQNRADPRYGKYMWQAGEPLGRQIVDLSLQAGAPAQAN